VKIKRMDVAILAGIVLLVFISYRFLAFDPEIIPREKVFKEVDLLIENVTEEFINQIEIGAQAQDGSGAIIAEVIDKRQETYFDYIGDSAGKVVRSSVPGKYNLYVKLRLAVIKRRHGFYFQQEGVSEYYSSNITLSRGRQANYSEKANYIRYDSTLFVRLEKISLAGTIDKVY